MSESMVERVARAIADKHGFEHIVFFDMYRDLARAAIEAMETPTEAMDDAGYKSQLDDNWPDPRPKNDEGYEFTSEVIQARLAYRAMIDAALKE